MLSRLPLRIIAGARATTPGMVEGANASTSYGNAAARVTKGAAERARNILKKLEAAVP